MPYKNIEEARAARIRIRSDEAELIRQRTYARERARAKKAGIPWVNPVPKDRTSRRGLPTAKRAKLTGKVFNQLTALRFNHMNERKSSVWLFRYSCGVEKLIVAAQVVAGMTKSCGCRTHRTHRGYNKLSDGESSFNGLFSSYKYSAKQRDLSFELSEEQFRKLSKKDCTYCGTPPLQLWLKKTAVTGYLYNGIDRMDSTKGYTENNVAPCCKTCNYAKHTMGTSQFMEWIKRLVAFNTNLKVMPRASEQEQPYAVH